MKQLSNKTIIFLNNYKNMSVKERKESLENKKQFKELIDFYNKRYGFKTVSSLTGLTYTVVRNIFVNLEKYDLIERRKGTSIVTDKLKEFRKIKALNESKNKIEFLSEESLKKTKIRNTTSRGIQGYYWNKTFNKYVWLRSSWEFIYAKWLDKRNIPWDIEIKVYALDNNETYKPDFFIFSENKSKLKYIVEIKGFWDREKHFQLNNIIKEEVIVIKDIKPYITEDSNYRKEVIKWKQLRK